MFLILFFSALPFALAQDFTCPHSVIIHPCDCSSSETGVIVQCDGLASLEDLVTIVRGLERITVQLLQISNSDISNFPEDVFENLDIQSIELINCNLLTLGHKPFRSLANQLLALTIQNSYFHDQMGSMTFAHLTNLRSLNLEFNEIPILRKEMFGDIPLIILSIQNSEVETLEENVFESLGSLVQLNLDHNQIQTLSRSMFAKDTNLLKTLNLGGNAIEELPEDVFSEMPNLEHVFLNHNKLTTLGETIWADVWRQLRGVDVTENDIECDANMSWISHQKTRPDSLEGECSGPDQLAGKQIKDLREEDF